MAQMDAMAYVLIAIRDKLRRDNKWKKGQCRISFGTTPITNGVPWFVGIEELDEDNLADQSDEFNRIQHGVRIGLWMDAEKFPNDREGIMLGDEDIYLRDRVMLKQLEDCVVPIVQSYDTLQCINDLLAKNARPDCYDPALNRLMYMGRNATEIVSSIPSINVTNGRWARRILQFRGANQVVTR